MEIGDRTCVEKEETQPALRPERKHVGWPKTTWRTTGQYGMHRTALWASGPVDDRRNEVRIGEERGGYVR